MKALLIVLACGVAAYAIMVVFVPQPQLTEMPYSWQEIDGKLMKVYDSAQMTGTYVGRQQE